MTQQIFTDRIENKVNSLRLQAREVWYYESATEGTRVTVKSDVTVRGIAGKFRLLERAERNLSTVLSAQKRIAESS